METLAPFAGTGMKPGGNILVIQTAFIGDVILITPMLDALAAAAQDVTIDVVVIPAAAPLLINHPAVRDVIVYDKRGRDKGITGALRLVRRLRNKNYDAAVIPHRSLRSGLVAVLSGIEKRIGFSTSAASFLLSDAVSYKQEQHETERNLSLLRPLGIEVKGPALPSLFPLESDKQKVTRLFTHEMSSSERPLIGIAPGSVWATKRWPQEKYAALASACVEHGCDVVLIGGKDDVSVAEAIIEKVKSPHLLNAVGKLELLQSAELISRCRVLVTNDSAPLHMALAVRTPVVAIFGATVPEFGFGPIGRHDVVVQRSGLACRPCSIHGGHRCPIATFDCMQQIHPDEVMQQIRNLLSVVASPRS